MTIQLLDCTLRDGGYINEWNFGQSAIREIVFSLTQADLDYIEMGFMKNIAYDANKTLFHTIADFAPFVPTARRHSKYYGMIALGDYAIEDLPDFDGSSIDGIRVIFKKNKITEALSFCKQVKAKGYELFINPTFVDQYTDAELLSLTEQVNQIHPTGFCIVDSMGVVSPENLTRIFMLLDHNLYPDIKIGFHSHNNLQMSFMNAKTLIDLRSKRDLVIDVSVTGMGRGAGNLNAELMISYLNQNYNAKYNLLPILKISDEHIVKIFAKTPWGYSIPYFLAASVKCHPNYAKYLIDKRTVSVETINHLLQAIPNENKSTYDANIIKRLYISHLSNPIDDTPTLNYLEKEFSGKTILALAPGPSLKKEQEKIMQFISTQKPFIVSLNFHSLDFGENLIFATNNKRFSTLQDCNTPLLISSNLKHLNKQTRMINYSSYLNDSDMFDNVALMFFKLLVKIGIKQVYVAGLDGFSALPTQNYVSNTLINASSFPDYKKRNTIMTNEIQKLSHQISICFLTHSLYMVQEK